MAVFEIIILSIPALLIAIWFGIFVHRVGLKNLRQELNSRANQSEWYDEDGNHIYYDRKYIRYQQQQKQNAAVSQK